MRLPQVSERIKEAPAQALRGVFAGIGQLLLITDKLRNKTPADQQVPSARPPEPPQPAQDPGPPAASAPPSRSAASASSIPPAEIVPASPPEPAPSADPAPAPPAEPVLETRDLDKTGNVRLLTGEKARTGDTAPIADAMTTSDGDGAALAEEVGPVAETTASAPLPNYDELSIASLRARLRNLDIAQVRQLLVYEQAHAARPDVMAMFERRIIKLESEGADERGEAEVEAEAEAQEDVEAEVQADESEAVADES